MVVDPYNINYSQHHPLTIQEIYSIHTLTTGEMLQNDSLILLDTPQEYNLALLLSDLKKEHKEPVKELQRLCENTVILKNYFTGLKTKEAWGW